MKIMEIRGWRRLIVDRDEWKKLFEKAKIILTGDAEK
jgi:hypothetical protein